MERAQEISQARQLNENPIVQPRLAAGELQGRIVNTDRRDWGLSNKMICIYATCLLAGGYLACKNNKISQSIALFLWSVSITSIGLSLLRRQTALEYQRIYDRLYRLEGQIRAQASST